MGRRCSVVALAVAVVFVVGCGSSGRDGPIGAGSGVSGIRVAWADRSNGALWIGRGDGGGRTQVDQLWWPDGHECLHTPGCDPGGMGNPVWSSDASRLAYWIYASPRGRVLDLNDLDGRAVPNTRKWSDGHVERFRVMRTHPRALTGARRRGFAPAAFSELADAPVWSEDGSSVAFVRVDGNVEVVGVRTHRSLLLRTRRLAHAFHASFSPDGRRLALASTWGEGAWLADLRSGSLVRFAPQGARISELAWSPDSSRLVYTRGDVRGNGQLLVASIDGRRVTRLTNDVPSDRFAHFSNASAAWSPDGSKVAFLSNRDGAWDEELFVIDADGRHERRFTRGLFVQPPLRWSPDSRRIAFLGWPDPYLGVARVTGGVVRLMRQPPDDDGGFAPIDFAWTGSPRLATALPRARPAQAHRIYAVRDHAPRGSERIVRVRRLALLPEGSVNEPITALSPDGSLAAYVLRQGAHRFELGAVDVASGTHRLLVRSATLSPLDEEGIFSPDGRELLFRRWARLEAVDVRTGRVRTVVSHAGQGSYYWLRDGRVAYLDRDGRLDLTRPDGKPRALGVRLSPDEMYAPSPDGSRVLYQSASRIWLLDRRRRRRRPLGHGLSIQPGSWSPDGRRFALVRGAFSAQSWQSPDTIVYDAAGHRRVNLLGVRERDAESFTVSWSTDARWLLVVPAYGGTRPPPTRTYAYSAAAGRISRVLVGATSALVGPNGRTVFSRGYTRIGGTIRRPQYALRLFVGRLTAARLASAGPALRACRTAQLHVWVTHTVVGLGTVGGYLAFTNRSPIACRLSGWPRLTALRPGGSTTAVHVHATMFGPYVGGTGPFVRGVPVVTLRHGQTAVAAFTAGDHGATSAACPPPYRQLRVTPPGNTAGAVVPAWIAYYGHNLPSCTRIEVSMVVPASDMPPRG
jgi:Tol biopolymer transport system component